MPLPQGDTKEVRCSESFILKRRGEFVQAPGVLLVLILTPVLLYAPSPDLAPFAGLPKTPKATVAARVRGHA